ncbi:bifunctional glutamate N-acetyltransferase/amino-acid acetyltransferase ArgJ [Hahella aquimaris]|uniref:bifunctional glutamate N-acetyltransferase/amino-acid acetyltransferase ArgJ n=1 Tax=Hahella sp. HNIBRBA332 TaxID=3015983 RepID=UPI00273AA065|nr:bifunctional glutamate N-acetyltransferase/amino-acid acetyltransferase ArgJ [Hahella sp. HNIBRBA332]WLQ14112.1 bifunctional glutamate N-acetyltransferase/amino-acid acetyltransferase ArgJ [Hahella sp. HNIBRBA332]
MAVGHAPLPEFHPVAGVRIGVGSAGIKKPGRKDLVVFELCEGAQTAAVFTSNAFCAAPVTLAKRHLAEGSPRFLLINTGNANAGTGRQGMDNALRCCQALAQLGEVASEEVLPFSTGVIGEPLPVDKVVAGLPSALANLSENAWAEAAEGIMTTDTRPKGATMRLEIDGVAVHISGVSKGAGMIKPNMATMLGFVATDADIEPELLQRMLTAAANKSFNRITVDGDTSTNDACVLVATGRSGAPRFTQDNAELWRPFQEALDELMQRLAHAIVRDAEGATKFVAVNVQGATALSEALDVAYTIAHSPLVKTALFASDPNWGRILAAVGRAGLQNLEVERIHIYLNEVCIVEGGARAASYTEEAGQAVMDLEEITIRVDLGRGEVEDTVWTCDFSHEYVTINAEYRT